VAFPGCIFYGGDSDWNIVGGNISYLPISGPSPSGSRVFDNAVLTSSTVVNGIFANVLVDPSELYLYTSAYWEIRTGVSLGNGGTLIASGTCSGSTFHAIANGQNANSNIGVWFGCDLPSVFLIPGTFWFSVVPQATGATKQIFEWVTSSPTPYVGLHATNQAYYDSTFYGFIFADTLSGGLPYPTAGGPSDAFSWGLY
jgi:hypothetical protein